ncbi:MAG TPA: (d)CMP kinase [Pseudogracilibacillus sp.]|nr:(d)CMP kinase [Pseudogracilibacillus sp.]
MIVNKHIRIAIDGPAAAGKSTVAKQLAEDLSFVYIDTGAMYRAITLHCLRNGIPLTNEEAILSLLNETTIDLQYGEKGQHVLLNNEDVTDEIRGNDVSRNVSHIAKLPSVRDEMVERQRRLAEDINIIMDGRDIGTNVIPDAEVKIFLIASVEERAQRRYDENVKKGIPSNLLELKAEIAERDKLDRERKHAPLKRADDAIAIDTTSLSIDEVVAEIMKHVKKVL